MSTLINLIDEPAQLPAVEILQLYQDLELLRLDRPARHVLFVLGHTPDAPDRLLLIDPPADLATYCRTEEDVAALYTRTPQADAVTLDAPQLATQPGGTAHIRLGAHFLDIYTQGSYSIVHFPALGILSSGEFGSDVALPRLATGDNGDAALETVRILAALVKARPVKLLIPRVGELAQDVIPIMERLAADVAYLHNLQRIGHTLPAQSPSQSSSAPAHAESDPESDAKLEALAATLLPAARRDADAQATNLQNLQTLLAAQAH
ncbi:MAG: hypothetical protein WDZ49_09525 [Litorilinea sp.]